MTTDSDNVIIPTELFNKDIIGISEIRLFVYMRMQSRRLGSDADQYRPSNESLSKATSIPLRSIQTALKRLEDVGYITRDVSGKNRTIIM